MRGVLLPLGENEIELLQPVREDTGVARFLESRGPTLHHLCLRTDDIRAELARVKAFGVELIDEEPRYGLAGEIAFLHPGSMHGVLVELAEVSDPQGSLEKGFDRVSCRVGDYEAAKRRWQQVAGLEERMRYDLDEAQIVIGQLAIGQVLLELIRAERAGLAAGAGGRRRGGARVLGVRARGRGPRRGGRPLPGGGDRAARSGAGAPAGQPPLDDLRAAGVRPEHPADRVRVVAPLRTARPRAW